MKKFIPQKIKNIYHLFCSMLAVVWFGFPVKKIKVIGVTGTNGKTTTVQIIGKILEEAGNKVAVSSTINFKIGDKEWVNKTKFTTRSGWHTQKFIRRTVNEKCTYLVLEVASHALDQNRIWGVDFDVAVITNVTREHLDYHGTMREYRKAKKKLFGMLKPDGKAVVNLDMEDPEEFLKASEDCEKYGFTMKGNRKSEIVNRKRITDYGLRTTKAVDIKLDLNKTEFTIDDTDFKLSLVGSFNIENALAAICVGLSQKTDLETASKALEKIEKISGRMDYVENNRGLKIIIDYALTPDSMEKLGRLIRKSESVNRNPDCQLSSEGGSPSGRQTTNYKLIWVFGSCGERDRGKRPMMGKIVSKYADYVIVTNEDPYDEDPMKIINEVFSGVVGAKSPSVPLYKGGSGSPNYDLRFTNYEAEDAKIETEEGMKKSAHKKIENVNAWRIMDRKKAIKKALDIAREGDVILITGKGAEETMAVGRERIRWNDRKVIEELLKKY